MMATHEIFLDLLKKKRGFYASILEITKEEHKKFDANRPVSEIRPLLNQKKVLLACIEALEDEIAPLKAEMQNYIQASDHPSVPLIQVTIKELSLMLDEILHLDTLNQKYLQTQLNTIKSALV